MTEPTRGIITEPVLSDELLMRRAEIDAIRTLNESIGRLDRRLEKIETRLDENRENILEFRGERFREEIARVEKDAKEETARVLITTDKHSERLNRHDVMLGRFGMFMAITGGIASMALGLIIARIFGVHP